MKTQSTGTANDDDDKADSKHLANLAKSRKRLLFLVCNDNFCTDCNNTPNVENKSGNSFLTWLLSKPGGLIIINQT